MTQQLKYGHNLFFSESPYLECKKMICENVRFSSFPSQSLSILHQNHRFFINTTMTSFYMRFAYRVHVKYMFSANFVKHLSIFNYDTVFG